MDVDVVLGVGGMDVVVAEVGRMDVVAAHGGDDEIEVAERLGGGTGEASDCSKSARLDCH